MQGLIIVTTDFIDVYVSRHAVENFNIPFVLTLVYKNSLICCA